MKHFLWLALALGTINAQTTSLPVCTTRDRHLTVRNCRCPAVTRSGDPPMVRIVRITTTSRIGYRCIRQCATSATATPTQGTCGCSDQKVRVAVTAGSTKGFKCKIPCTEDRLRLTTLDCGCKAGFVKKTGRTRATSGGSSQVGYRCEQQDLGEFQKKIKLPFIGNVAVKMLIVGGVALVIILCLLVIMCSYKSKYDEMVLNLDNTVMDAEDMPDLEDDDMGGKATPMDPRLNNMLSARGTSIGRKSITDYDNAFDEFRTKTKTMPKLTSTEGEEAFQEFVDNLKNMGFFKNYEPGTSDYDARMEKVKERWQAKTG